MDLVEIQLNSFLYHFRRLSWIEESAIKTPDGEDPRTILLAHALHDISGMPVSSIEDATRIVRAIPRTLRWRIWVIYRGNLPADRYFSTKGLYEAPEPQVYNKQLGKEAEAGEQALDAEVTRRFGTEDTEQTRETERRIMDNALKTHMLRTARGITE